MGEFKEEWEKGMVGWNSENKICEGPVGECREVGNRALEEDQVNTDLEENKLGDLQYKLSQRNGKFSRDRSPKIIEQGMPGIREEFRKEETYNCVFGAERKKKK